MLVHDALFRECLFRGTVMSLLSSHGKWDGDAIVLFGAETRFLLLGRDHGAATHRVLHGLVHYESCEKPPRCYFLPMQQCISQAGTAIVGP